MKTKVLSGLIRKEEVSRISYNVIQNNIFLGKTKLAQGQLVDYIYRILGLK